MIKKLFCNNCDDFVDYNIEKMKEKRVILDKAEIEIQANIAVCKKCNNELFHEILEKDNQNKAYKKYNKKGFKPKLELNKTHKERLKEIKKHFKNLTEEQFRENLKKINKES